MKFLKEYKGVALVYLVITLINVVFIVNYEKPGDIKQASKERNVVLNAWFLSEGSDIHEKHKGCNYLW